MTNFLKKDYICKMKITTKQKIINKAIELFNTKGFASVTLFEIAGALAMTRGNLTYHFKDKDFLLKAISEEFWAKVEKAKSKKTSLPSFESMHNEIQMFYSVQKTYAFIFLDYHVLSHPIIREQFRARAAADIKRMETTIAFAIAAGNMHSEPYEGIYHNLAFNTWMVSFFWLNQQMVRGIEANGSSEAGERKIWSLLLPHLTEKGLKAFRAYFGESYIKELGKAFQTDISNYLKF